MTILLDPAYAPQRGIERESREGKHWSPLTAGLALVRRMMGGGLCRGTVPRIQEKHPMKIESKPRAENAAARRQMSSAPRSTVDKTGLPSFKASFNTQKLHTYDGGTSKMVNVADFPVSKSVAGVFMTLEPGGLRELHWHANAAEWAYVFEGNMRVTILDAEGRSEIADLGPGDLWYFPKGHAHSLEGRGPGTATFLLAFDNGAFDEFATFDITDWLAKTPKEIVAKSLGLSIHDVDTLPKREVYISQGVVPPPLAKTKARGGRQASPPLSHVFRLRAQRPFKDTPDGQIWLASQREFPMSTTMTGLFMRLQSGGLRELHWHPNADEWQYVSKGRLRLTVFASTAGASVVELGPGDVGFVPMGFGHALESVGDEPAEAILILNSGDYQEISLSGWIASNPDYVLETNLPGVPDSVIERLPRGERFFTGPKR